MFEYQIQKAWEQYQDDFGLGRNCLFIIFFNLLMFFLSAILLGQFYTFILYPVMICFIFYFLRRKVIRLPHWAILLIGIIPVTLTIVLNYFLIGILDESLGGLLRLDPFFVTIDSYLWKGRAADQIYHFLGPLGKGVRRFFYDTMMLAYYCYFLVGIFGATVYYRLLPKNKRFKIGRYFASIILFYHLNFIFYLIVPVTGPQFWQKDLFNYALPLSSFGQGLWLQISNAQGTFIDCFPSGHTGITTLVTFWLFRINHGSRYFCLLLTILIMAATLAMRYHYTLDLIAAIPLAYFCFRTAFLLFPARISPEDFRRH